VTGGSGGRVLAAIINYRSGALAVDCLRSLESEVRTHAGLSVLVVDNCSPDDSAELIGKAIVDNGWSGWARLEQAPVNGGFSYGNNVAIRQALASAVPYDFVWLINPDTQVRPGALAALLDVLAVQPKAGIAGSGFEDGMGRDWPYAFRFPTVWSEIDAGLRFGPVTRLLSRWVVAKRMGAQPELIDWVPGASMIVRREVFESVGLMDEGYFLYFEETDFCLAARRAGWLCWYVPQSRVMHLAGQSTGVTGEGAAARRLPGYWFESRRRYFIKNYGLVYGVLADVAWIVGHCLWRLRCLLQRKPLTVHPHQLRDFVAHSALWHWQPPGNSRLTR